MSQVDLLYRLQQIDDAIREGKKQLARVISLQKESSDLEAARRTAEIVAEDLKKWRSKQNVLNLELSTLNEKIKREEIRLYSGTIKNPKELADIQHELESLGRRSSALEDELIEAMIMVEDTDREYVEAGRELEAIETKWVKDQESLKAERGELITTINDLINQRKQHLTSVSSESMAAYQNAIRRAGNMAVVLLKGSRCSGCQVTVPANLVKSTEDGNLVICDNCSRVLCPM
jgi:predicted  nucleic acid-binding Zn-ribbon protein